LIGDRGCGKTTIGRNLAERRGLIFIDLDEKITEEIQMRGYSSIDDLVTK
jgi:shikimate kinase